MWLAYLYVVAGAVEDGDGEHEEPVGHVQGEGAVGPGDGQAGRTHV